MVNKCQHIKVCKILTSIKVNLVKVFVTGDLKSSHSESSIPDRSQKLSSDKPAWYSYRWAHRNIKYHKLSKACVPG